MAQRRNEWSSEGCSAEARLVDPEGYGAEARLVEAKSDMAQEDAMEEADFSEVVRPGGEKDWPK